MGKRGDGYGSEDHLRNYLAKSPHSLTAAVATELGADPSSIQWLPYPATVHGDREYRALEFLPAETRNRLRTDWSRFWPQRGHQQSWDAIGLAGDDWLLVEAKASWPEFCTPPTTATSKGLHMIEAALAKVRRDLGVSRWLRWTGSYYQYANRLATLWFLRSHGIAARLVFVYFVGDRFPDGAPCPGTEGEWDALIEARRLTLGLPPEHGLTPYEHHVFLPALKTGPAKP